MGGLTNSSPARPLSSKEGDICWVDRSYLLRSHMWINQSLGMVCASTARGPVSPFVGKEG